MENEVKGTATSKRLGNIDLGYSVRTSLVRWQWRCVDDESGKAFVTYLLNKRYKQR
jgi:hypothetical protein